MKRNSEKDLYFHQDHDFNTETAIFFVIYIAITSLCFFLLWHDFDGIITTYTCYNWRLTIVVKMFVWLWTWTYFESIITNSPIWTLVYLSYGLSRLHTTFIKIFSYFSPPKTLLRLIWWNAKKYEAARTPVK